MRLRDLPQWRNTVVARDRVSDRAGYEEPDAEAPHGKWQGRHIIGRDTAIHGGVYIGNGAREAIVVDEDYQLLGEVYRELVLRRERAVAAGGEWNQGVLREVYDLVKLLIPYNQRVVDQINCQYQVGPDNKIRLDRYIEHGGGVCRHQALLCAYLLEKAILEGHLRGRVSVDRNVIPGVGGHAWVRYTSSGNTVHIIDPAQSYCGPLDQVNHQEFGRWFYLRPEEMKNK